MLWVVSIMGCVVLWVMLHCNVLFCRLCVSCVVLWVMLRCNVLFCRLCVLCCDVGCVVGYGVHCVCCGLCGRSCSLCYVQSCRWNLWLSSEWTTSTQLLLSLLL